MTRPPTRRLALRAAAGFAALAVAGGCSTSALSGPSDPAPSTTTFTPPTKKADPPPPPPEVGACRQLSYSAIGHYSNTAPTVPCSGSHTAYTFDVQTIPSDVNVAGVSISNKSIQDAASAGCRSAFDRFIGGDAAKRALSRLSVTYFLPEQAGFNRGAHWVRCDVVALETASALAPLPKNLKGFLDQPASLHSYGVCSHGAPGAQLATLVMCTQPHGYRALTTLRLGAATAPYPGRAVAGPAGQQRCSDFLAEKLGSTAGYSFAWTYPTPADWAAGQRFGYCWEKTHH
jgi:Septum formation